MKWFAYLFLVLSAAATATPLVFVGNEKIDPMIYQVDGRPAGLVIELVQAAANAADIDVELVAMNWADAQTEVRDGRADALMQINPTPERRQWLAFSQPLLVSEFTVFSRSGLGEIRDLDQAKHLTIGVEPGSFPAQMLTSKA